MNLGVLVIRAVARALATIAIVALVVACKAGPETYAGPHARPEPSCQELSWSDAPERRSVVLIVNDAWRTDRLGAYGGPAGTPVFDRFARENLLFLRAYTQSPWTKPAMATLFTGLYPSQHGQTTHPKTRDHTVETDFLGDKFVTLAERLQDAGYETAALVANPWLLKQFGFAQGFDTYDDSFAALDTPGRVVSEAGLRWLFERTADRPYFLYLHYVDSHTPYARLTREEVAPHLARIAADPRRVSPRAANTIRKYTLYRDESPIPDSGVPANIALLELVYDQGVQHFDEALGLFLEGFKAHESAEQAAVLLTSDHGEALFEHGWGRHGFGLHDDETSIPFAAKLPGVRADGPVECAVGLIDLTATLCTYLGLDCAGPDFGVSFLRAPGESEPADRYVVSEAVFSKPGHRSIRNRHYKLLWEPKGRVNSPRRASPYALYALGDDPGETRDLLESDLESAEVRAVFDILAARLAAAVPPFGAPGAETVPVDPQSRERLEALGYLE